VTGHRHMRRVVLALAVTLIGVTAAVVASAWTVSLNSGSHGEGHAHAAPAAPASPTAVCVLSSTQTVKVPWTAVTHASSYTISDSTTGSGGTYNTVASGVTTNPYTTATLSAGTYYVKINAVIGTNWTGTESVATSPGRVISTTSPHCQ
jgi:hypothetical protein